MSEQMKNNIIEEDINELKRKNNDKSNHTINDLLFVWKRIKRNRQKPKQSRNDINGVRKQMMNYFVIIYKIAHHNKMLVGANDLKPVPTEQFDCETRNEHNPTERDCSLYGLHFTFSQNALTASWSFSSNFPSAITPSMSSVTAFPSSLS